MACRWGDRLLEWINNVATGITIGSGAISVQSLISGYTLAKRVDLIASRLEMLDGRIVKVDAALTRLDTRLYSSGQQSVFVTKSSGLALPNAKLIMPTKATLLQFGPSFESTSLIADAGLEAPKGFFQEFINEPEHFLHAVQPLRSGMPDIATLRDPTLVPWHFKKDGIDYIGFVKKGYLKSYLGIEFKPTILNDRMRFAFENRYTGASMSRNEVCYCGSGKRYKHCCGSLN